MALKSINGQTVCFTACPFFIVADLSSLFCQIHQYFVDECLAADV